MVRHLLAASVCLSALSSFGETADLLEAIADMTLGSNFLEDIGESFNAATELPDISELGEAFMAASGLDFRQLPQGVDPQRGAMGVAESLISPFTQPLEELRALPARLTPGLNALDSSSPRSNGSSKPSFSLRGVSPFDPAELERLAESIAENVANGTGMNLRNAIPLPLVAAGAGRNPGVSGEASPPSSASAAAAAVAQLIDPLGLLQSQRLQEKQQVQLQAAEVADVERQAEREAEETFDTENMTEKAGNASEEKTERERLLEKEAEEDVMQVEANNNALTEAQQEKPETDSAFTGAAETSSSAAQAEEKKSVVKAAAKAAAKAALEADRAFLSGGEKGGKSPQRVWSRTNPFGILQIPSDNLYFLNWALLNPLAMLEWKAFVFNQCMALVNDEEICTRTLKVEPNTVNHGGINSPWVPSTSP